MVFLIRLRLRKGARADTDSRQLLPKRQDEQLQERDIPGEGRIGLTISSIILEIDIILMALMVVVKIKLQKPQIMKDMK